jgi:3-oxoacyl-[acyl-carrier-protein] synthase II
MNRRVAITGLGLVSPHGTCPQTAFEAWCAGQSSIQTHQVGADAHTLSAALSLCRQFDASAFISRQKILAMDPVAQLSVVSCLKAWDDAGLHDASDALREQTAVFWGTGGGGMQSTERSYRDLFIKNRARISPLSVVWVMTNAAASQIALHLGLGADCLTYSVACASSAVALGEAFHAIRSGRHPLIVAGGAEAALPYGSLKAWESLRIMDRPLSKAADPFMPSAKASFWVKARPPWCLRTLSTPPNAGRAFMPS